MGRRQAICVSTSKPTASLTPGGGGGAITLICPHSGSILSSLRASGDNSSKSLLGLSSISMLPSKFGTLNTSLMMAYGGTVSKKDDTYGMLLTLRNVSSPPILNWKCRLPEAQMSAGLLVSPCGHFVVGGSNTGNIIVWSTLGGCYLRTIKAHYRPITAMVWSDCASYLLSGGADGMVHVFSLMDLVDRGENRTISPVRSWSSHHLPVSALQVVGGSRFVSSSEDGQLVLMEIFSEATLATIQISTGIQSLAFHDGRIYAGSVQGTIYAVDLEVYAAHQTSQLGVTVKRRKISVVTADNVFEQDSSDCYKAELRGHETCVTALTILVDEVTYLISGDSSGTLRVWDLESRGCVRVILPWSFSIRTTATSDNETTKSSGSHPVTSITVVSRGDESPEQSEMGTFGAVTSKESKANSIVNLVTPLKSFPDIIDEGKPKTAWVPVPFLRPKRSKSSLAYMPLKETRVASRDADTIESTTLGQDEELARLRKELNEAREKSLLLEEENSCLKKQVESM